jgi:DNA-binding IclR family transcriptional regulator
MSDINKRYLSEQVQRTLRVITIMAGNEVNGISPGEIAKIAETSSANVTRILANLQHFGFAEPLPADHSRFRLAAPLVQLSNTVSMNFRQHQQQIQQEAHNFGLLAI